MRRNTRLSAWSVDQVLPSGHSGVMDDISSVRVTYAELGRARGISAAAAKRLSNRHRWPKQVGNDGLSRVTVPAAMMSPFVRGDAPADGIRDDSGADPADCSGGGSRDDPSATQTPPVDIAAVTRLIDAAVAASDDARVAAAAIRDQMNVERERADRAEERARAAEDRLKEVQGLLESEVAEHRRIVALLVERLPVRRGWRLWRRG